MISNRFWVPNIIYMLDLIFRRLKKDLKVVLVPQNSMAVVPFIARNQFHVQKNIYITVTDITIRSELWKDLDSFTNS